MLCSVICAMLSPMDTEALDFYLCQQEIANHREKIQIHPALASMPFLRTCPEQHSVSSMAIIFLISLITSCNSILLFTDI